MCIRDRYRPMPVAEPWARPFLPVKPRSNTRGTSAAGMPGPSSAISSTVRAALVPAPSSRTVKRTDVAPYFAAFTKTCPSAKESQEASANTVTPSPTSMDGVVPLSLIHI